MSFWHWVFPKLPPKVCVSGLLSTQPSKFWFPHKYPEPVYQESLVGGLRFFRNILIFFLPIPGERVECWRLLPFGVLRPQSRGEVVGYRVPIFQKLECQSRKIQNQRFHGIAFLVSR